MNLIGNLVMTAIWPVQFTGVWGSPESPRSYRAGDAVPWWIEHVEPAWARITFAVDVECYFDPSDGRQHVFPATTDPVDGLIEVDAPGCHVRVTGAPTTLHGKPPPKRRRRARPPIVEWPPA